MVTRCSNNYGLRQFPEKMLPLFVTNLIDGQKVRSWVTACTFASGCTSTTTAGNLPGTRKRSSGEIYNIGGDTELTNIEMTHRLLKLCGYDDTMIEVVPNRLGHDRRYSVDWSKIKNELATNPRRF